MIVIDDFCIAIPPSETIIELMEINGMTKAQLNELIHVDVNKLLDGELFLDNVIAERLEQVFGIKAIVWLRLEYIYRKKLKEIAERNLEYATK